MGSKSEAWEAALEKCELLALRARNEQPQYSDLYCALDEVLRAIEQERDKGERPRLRSIEEAFCRARDKAVMHVIKTRDEFPESSEEFDTLDDLMCAMIERVGNGPLGTGWRPVPDPTDIAST